MRVLVGLIAAATVAGCVSSPTANIKKGMPITLTDTQKQAVMRGVQEDLRDPASAMFGAMYASKDADGMITVCGGVNARNGFGGYAGPSIYNGILMDVPGAQPVFSVAGIGTSEIERNAVAGVCNAAGTF